MSAPTPPPVRVAVNGSPTELPAGTTLADLVADLDRAGRGVAVAVDEEVVPRSLWAERSLQEGERVEVLSAVQGG